MGLELGRQLRGLESGAKQRIIYATVSAPVEHAAVTLDVAPDLALEDRLRVELPVVDGSPPGLVGGDAIDTSALEFPDQTQLPVSQSLAARDDVVPRQFGIVEIAELRQAGDRQLDVLRLMAAARETLPQLGDAQRSRCEQPEPLRLRPLLATRPLIVLCLLLDHGGRLADVRGPPAAGPQPRGFGTAAGAQLLVNSKGDSGLCGSAAFGAPLASVASRASWAMSEADWMPANLSLNSSGLDACLNASSKLINSPR